MTSSFRGYEDECFYLSGYENRNVSIFYSDCDRKNDGRFFSDNRRWQSAAQECFFCQECRISGQGGLWDADSFVFVHAGGVYLPGKYSLIHQVETKFIRPVFVGDVLTVKGEVAELNDTVEQMLLKVVITNQKGEKVLRGSMKVGFLHER